MTRRDLGLAVAGFAAHGTMAAAEDLHHLAQAGRTLLGLEPGGDDGAIAGSLIMESLSRALDEIYRLRTLLAYEAGVLGVHTEYKSFPKSRRDAAIRQMERMVGAAAGNSEVAMAGISSLSLRAARERAGFETLTRAQWEAEAKK